MTRSTSSAEVRWVGAAPSASPRSWAAEEPRACSPDTVRSGTSRMNQESANAISAIGTAVRKTGCSASL